MDLATAIHEVTNWASGNPAGAVIAGAAIVGVGCSMFVAARNRAKYEAHRPKVEAILKRHQPVARVDLSDPK